jgi:hypothetical protein
MLSAQGLCVALLVAVCAAYAVWTLMPSAARRACARAALRLPLPATLAAPLQRAARPGSACGCDGCDRAAAPPAAASVQTVKFHPRPPR